MSVATQWGRQTFSRCRKTGDSHVLDPCRAQSSGFLRSLLLMRIRVYFTEGVDRMKRSLRGSQSPSSNSSISSQYPEASLPASVESIRRQAKKRSLRATGAISKEKNTQSENLVSRFLHGPHIAQPDDISPRIGQKCCKTAARGSGASGALCLAAANIKHFQEPQGTEQPCCPMLSINSVWFAL